MGVTDTQLYVTIGLPILAILRAFVGNMVQYSSMMSRLSSMESQFDSRFSGVDSRFASLEAQFNSRFSSVENRLTSIDARFDTLTGKVIEIDNHLTRVEAILERR